MEEQIRPSFQTRDYKISESCFIRDRYQCYLYIKHGARPLDMYVSSNEDLVMVFDKKDTKELYEKYRRYELD